MASTSELMSTFSTPSLRVNDCLSLIPSLRVVVYLFFLSPALELLYISQPQSWCLLSFILASELLITITPRHWIDLNRFIILDLRVDIDCMLFPIAELRMSNFTSFVVLRSNTFQSPIGLLSRSSYYLLYRNPIPILLLGLLLRSSYCLLYEKFNSNLIL